MSPSPSQAIFLLAVTLIVFFLFEIFSAFFANTPSMLSDAPSTPTSSGIRLLPISCSTQTSELYKTSLDIKILTQPRYILIPILATCKTLSINLNNLPFSPRHHSFISNIPPIQILISSSTLTLPGSLTMQSINSEFLHDIETAVEFTSFKNSFPPTDYHFNQETLFFTDSHNWYLFVLSGPLSKQSQLFFHPVIPHLEIFPLTVHQAFNWIVKHSTLDKIYEFFLRHPSDKATSQ